MYRLDETTKERLIKTARGYALDELKLFQDELGWEDWMSEFTSAEDGEEFTEGESDAIDDITKQIFEFAHSGITRTWKVYGCDGHRQRESFAPSVFYNFSNELDGVGFLEVLNSDTTGTNEYTILRITRNTAEECEREFWGQISDGVFENSRTGRVEEI